MLITRNNVAGSIVRAPGLLYQERGTDSISNLYTIKVVNKTLDDLNLNLKLENTAGRIFEAEGTPIVVKKEAQGKGSFFIILPKQVISDRKTDLKVGIYEGNKKITVLSTTFMGPFTKKNLSKWIGDID